MPKTPKGHERPKVATVAQIKHLLTGFKDLLARSVIPKADSGDRNLLETVVSGYSKAFAQWKQKQSVAAEDFNILETLEITGKEIRHSMMLAWLLDHDLLRHGTHAQGSLGFELFLDALGLPTTYAQHPYWVRREVQGEESRVDLEVAARGNFLIHIENKIWSREGDSQTAREWIDLERRALELEARSFHAVFLTPDGHAPVNRNFIPMSWGLVANILQQFSERAQAPEVKLFSAHYSHALELFVVRKLEETSSHGSTDLQ